VRGRARVWVLAGVLAASVVGATGRVGGQEDGPAKAPARPLVLVSKNFEESRLLAEMFAQLIERETTLSVERRFNLAGTQVCLEAVRTGAADLYPEYTGTGLVSILGLPAETDRAKVLATVRREFAAKWDLVWLAPLGFENSFAIALRQETAQRLGVTTLSGLGPRSKELRAGLGLEFVQRPDGYPGLQETYGLDFGEVRALQHALKYQAAGAGEIDALDVYTTDGEIARHGLVVLDDDRRFFPPYEAAPLVRGATLRAHPEIAVALARLAGVLDETRMRRWNLALQEQTATVEEVAEQALAELGLIDAAVRSTESSARDLGLLPYLWQERAELWGHTLEHLALVLVSLLLAAVVGLPLGIGLERHPRFAEPILRAIGLLQTIPSIALLAFMIPLLGIGARPAIAALFLYALLPIVRNAYVGVSEADPVASDSAWALGMTRGQVLREVRLPLAAPTILAGIRTAAVINVGTATLAAFIGAGGLGVPIVSGIQMANATVILSGALPAAGLALIVDGVLAAIERNVRPKGVRA